MRIERRKAFVYALSLLLLAGSFFVLIKIPRCSPALSIGFECLLFISALIVGCYIPGSVALAVLRCKPPPLERLVLSLRLGMILSTLLFFLLGIAGLLDFALPSLVPIAVFWAILRFKTPIGTCGTISDFRRMLFLLPAIMIVFISLILCTYRFIYASSDGGMFCAKSLVDGFFHSGIISEVSRCIPPTMPYCAGKPLFYHYAMDLEVGLIYKIAGINRLHLVFRYFPTYYLLIMVISAFVFARRFSRSDTVASLFSVLIFGTGFSFLTPLFLGNWGGLWQDYLGAPAIFSMYCFNSMLPAWSILFCALYCLLMACENGKPSWVVLAGFFSSVLLFFKIFVQYQLIAALFITSLLAQWKSRKSQGAKHKTLWAVFIVAVCPTILFTYCSFLYNPTSFKVWVSPLCYYYRSFRSLSLESSLLKSILLFPVYLALLFGIRIVAIPAVGKGLKNGKAPVRSVICWFIVIGLILFLNLRIAQSLRKYNNSSWFGVASLIFLWLFVAEILERYLDRKKPIRSALILIAVFALSFPSTIQFFYYVYPDDYVKISSDEIKAAEFLKMYSDPSAVVLCSRNRGRPSVPAHLAGKRVVIGGWQCFANTLVGDENERRKRSIAVKEFYKTNDSQKAAETLRRYGVSWVYLGSKDKIRFDDKGILERVFRSGRERICRVLPLSAAPGSREGEK